MTRKYRKYVQKVKKNKQAQPQRSVQIGLRGKVVTSLCCFPLIFIPVCVSFSMCVPVKQPDTEPDPAQLWETSYQIFKYFLGFQPPFFFLSSPSPHSSHFCLTAPTPHPRCPVADVPWRASSLRQNRDLMSTRFCVLWQFEWNPVNESWSKQWTASAELKDQCSKSPLVLWAVCAS